ncbi:hypothetical protein, partial [Dermatophilus congolensis]
MPTTNHAAWEAALTQMEDELNAHEADVRNGSTIPVAPWEPPENLGDLPPELADRAHHLIERINLLSTFVKYQLQALDADREHARRQEHKSTLNHAVAVFL